MTDANYKQVLNYYRRCLLLARGLDQSDRISYIKRINEFLQETWYDFIWRTNLNEEELINILEIKENIKQELSSDLIHEPKFKDENTALLNGGEKYLFIRYIGFLITFAMFFWIFVYLMKNICCPNDRERRSSSERTSTIRKYNEDPPSISASSFTTNVYRVSDLQKDGPEGNKQVRNISVPQQKVLTLWEKLKECFFRKTGCEQDLPEVTLISLTSSGVSMDETFQPMFMSIRKIRKDEKATTKINKNED